MTVFITGTDTDVGKTIVSAWAMLHLHAHYWKPIQCGLEPWTDSQRIRELTKCPSSHVHPSAYELTHPLSPHEAAKRSKITISLSNIQKPETEKKLIIEGAGGVLVPINQEQYITDLITHLNVPVLLVCRSTLGTINHTLLSIEALRNRKIEILGAVMVGPETSHNREAIETFGKVSVVAELPIFNHLHKKNLLSIKPKDSFFKDFS